MKAITLHQPYASLIAEGVKVTETRSWAPPDYMMGRRIAIHAGRYMTRVGAVSNPTFYWMLAQLPQSCKDKAIHEHRHMRQCFEAALPRGAIVATAKLASVETVREPRAWMDYTSDGVIYKPGVRFLTARVAPVCPHGDYSIGRKIWFLEDIEKVNPALPVKGMQGLWEVPASVITERVKA